MSAAPGLADLAVYLINLDRAPERRARMESVLAQARLAHERVSAVDGATLAFPHADFDAWGYAVLHGRRTIPAEVGCYLSHVLCARRLLAGSATHALVLEDDVALPPDVRALLEASLRCSDDWDVLRLSTVNAGPKFAYRVLDPLSGRRLAVALTREKGAGAYVINRAAAAWICDALLPMRLSWDIAFDLEYFAGLRASFVVPVPVSQCEEPVSQIQHDVGRAKLPVWRYATVLPYRAWLETGRVVLRSAAWVRLRWRGRRLAERWTELATVAGVLCTGWVSEAVVLRS
jgi:glycosyl transferase family 25